MNQLKKLAFLFCLFYSVFSFSQTQYEISYNLVCWNDGVDITTLKMRTYEVIPNVIQTEFRDLVTDAVVVPNTGIIGDCALIASSLCNIADTSIYTFNGTIPLNRAATFTDDGSLTFAREDASRIMWINNRDSFVVINTFNDRGVFRADKDYLALNYLNTGIFYLNDNKVYFQDYRNFGLRSGIEYENPRPDDWTDSTLITRGYFLENNNWGDQIAITDTTLNGNGTPGNPLGVDTNLIATQYDISQLGINYAPLGGLGEPDSDGAMIDRNNINKGIALEVLNQQDSLIILDNSKAGNKKFTLIPQHKLLNGRRTEELLIPGSGISIETLDANTNVIIINSSGGNGMGVVDLGAGSSDGDTRREVTLVLNGLNSSEQVSVRDNGTPIDTFTYKTSLIKCVHTTAGWTIYPTAHPTNGSVTPSSGGNSRQVTTSGDWVDEVFFRSYNYIPNGTAHITNLFKGLEPGSEFQVRINILDAHTNGDCVCLYGTGNSGSVYGLLFQGYTSSNVKNIDGNNTTTASPGPGPQPTLEITADNNTSICAWYFAGQWLLKSTDE